MRNSIELSRKKLAAIKAELFGRDNAQHSESLSLQVVLVK
jgi:hypothetical protein